MESEKLLRIEFEFKDAYTHGEWRRQTCTMRSVEECVQRYGLGVDCEYRILSVKEAGD